MGWTYCLYTIMLWHWISSYQLMHICNAISIYQEQQARIHTPSFQIKIIIFFTLKCIKWFLTVMPFPLVMPNFLNPAMTMNAFTTTRFLIVNTNKLYVRNNLRLPAIAQPDGGRCTNRNCISTRCTNHSNFIQFLWYNYIMILTNSEEVCSGVLEQTILTPIYTYSFKYKC